MTQDTVAFSSSMTRMRPARGTKAERLALGTAPSSKGPRFGSGVGEGVGVADSAGVSCAPASGVGVAPVCAEFCGDCSEMPPGKGSPSTALDR